MSLWFLLQLGFNLFLISAIYVMWTRLRKPPQDDPRLSKGLQLLQSKISILEDLSDRTDTQVAQLSALLEQKAKKVQSKIEEAQSQLRQVEHSISKSKEMAHIFQDKIPHEEIIERNTTIKFVKAAKMAHQGKSVAEISKELDLPFAEVEFISKINKEQLIFESNNLPDWVKESLDNEDINDSDESLVLSESADDFEVKRRKFSEALEIPHASFESLKKIDDDFKKACLEHELNSENNEATTIDPLAKIREGAVHLKENFKEKLNKLKNKSEMIFDELPEVIMPKEPTNNLTSSESKLNLNSQQIEKAINLSPKSENINKTEFLISNDNPHQPFVTKVKSEKVIRKVEFPRIDGSNQMGTKPNFEMKTEHLNPKISLDNTNSIK